MTGRTKPWPRQSTTDLVDWSVDDLRGGDLVFASKAPRADWLEWLNEIADQRWRHVGTLVERDDGLHVVEIDKNAFGFRPLSRFLMTFDTYGAARLALAPECIASANSLMESQVDAQHLYAWDDVILAGLLCMTRPGIVFADRDRVRAALSAAASAAKEAQLAGTTDSFTCSGFVQWAYETVDETCTIVHDRWRSPTAWPPRLELLDDLLGGETEDFEELYRHATLLELLELSDLSDLGDEWRPSADQLGEACRVLLAAAGGWIRGAPPDRLVTDGRWVTPTDIWDSPSIERRGLIPKPRG